jgi:hypothetical protein
VRRYLWLAVLGEEIIVGLGYHVLHGRVPFGGKDLDLISDLLRKMHGYRPDALARHGDVF